MYSNDEFSRKYKNDNGNTECSYILEVKYRVSLIFLIKRGYTKETIEKVIDLGNIEELEKIRIKPGNMIYIQLGTVHVTEDGVKLIEVVMLITGCMIGEEI
ncbi:hypothetical protein [Terrisporobacter sp.]|uniref:hypothetical protein n=1 Tax=Terrisporobacter sp. TaxID=1965305 RepID=UPI002610A05E|nr:hypothetical protein [Terrisporobacter sp.]